MLILFGNIAKEYRIREEMPANIIINSGILPKEIEIRIAVSSLPAGKYLRNMAHAFEQHGYMVKNVTHVALPGASEAFREYKNNEDHKYILKDKLVLPSVLSYKRALLEMVQPGDIVIFYNVNYAQWGLVKKIRRRKGKSLLILADHTPPEERRNAVRRWMGKRDEREFEQFDYAVLLSQEATKYVRHDCKYEIIEGGLDTESFEDIESPRHMDKVVFMYAGTLEPVTGIDRLLDAFEKVDEDCRLVITGKGSLSALVQERADKDSRIDFRGYVSDTEYYRLLNEADILINPRNMELPENQNNFPSKVLEYLAAGRMTISSKFPGWERFSDNFSFYDNSVKGLSRLMKDVMATCMENADWRYDENRKKAEKFDWKKQTERIIKLTKG